MKRSRSVTGKYYANGNDFEEDESCDERIFCVCPFCEKDFEIKDDEYLYGEERRETREEKVSNLSGDDRYGQYEEREETYEDPADQEMQD